MDLREEQANRASPNMARLVTGLGGKPYREKE